MSWVMRLPGGLREQPAWIFVGTLCTLAGLSYLTGVSQSSVITQILDPSWVRTWGGFLCVSGLLLVGSTWVRNRPLERMSLRFLSLGLLIYMGWLMTAVPLGRAALTVTTCLALCVLAEIRVGVLTMAMRPLPPMPPAPPEAPEAPEEAD